MGWMQTYSGRKIYPLDLQVESISILDIAKPLSRMPRFAGHLLEFYTVAEHCVWVSKHVPEEHAMRAFAHDWSEAYLVDLPSPIKKAFGFEAYREAEHRAMRAICFKFALPLREDASIKQADLAALLTEQRDLMGPAVEEWPSEWFPDIRPCDHCTIKPAGSPEKAYGAFMERYAELFG
jgi:hypothetical protein